MEWIDKLELCKVEVSFVNEVFCAQKKIAITQSILVMAISHLLTSVLCHKTDELVSASM